MESLINNNAMKSSTTDDIEISTSDIESLTDTLSIILSELMVGDIGRLGATSKKMRTSSRKYLVKLMHIGGIGVSWEELRIWLTYTDGIIIPKIFTNIIIIDNLNSISKINFYSRGTECYINDVSNNFTDLSNFLGYCLELVTEHRDCSFRASMLPMIFEYKQDYVHLHSKYLLRRFMSSDGVLDTELKKIALQDIIIKILRNVRIISYKTYDISYIRLCAINHPIRLDTVYIDHVILGKGVFGIMPTGEAFTLDQLPRFFQGMKIDPDILVPKFVKRVIIDVRVARDFSLCNVRLIASLLKLNIQVHVISRVTKRCDLGYLDFLKKDYFNFSCYTHLYSDNFQPSPFGIWPVRGNN